MKRVGLFFMALTLFVGAFAAENGVNMDSLKGELRNEIVQTDAQLRQSQKDSILLSKLSPNQLIDLRKQELEVEKQRVENEGRNQMPFNGFQLFMICLLPFLFVTSIIYIFTKEKKEESKRRYDLYTKSLEMGQTVPDHFFDAPKKNKQTSNLSRGIICLAVGLALIIYFVIVDKYFALVGGIIPAFLGVGYLLVHVLEKPKTDTTVKNDEQHG